MWLKAYPFIFIVVVISNYDMSTCDPITNTNFNSHLRDYAADDTSNTTNVKTLQKAGIGSHANFAPAGHPIKFKETPDSALSGSSNSRGLLYHEHPGYTLNDYEDSPHLTYGHDFHSHDVHPDIHSLHGYDHGHYDHHNPLDHHEIHNSHDDHHHGQHDHHDHHEHHNHDYGHHHYSGHHHVEHGHYGKHFKHALAAKTALWPLAGIALLGAAAALVSNPVLLQLGVVSGKRRRRDTEEITGPDFPADFLTKYKETHEVDKPGLKSIGSLKNDKKLNNIKENLKKILLNTKHKGSRKIRSSVKHINQITKPFPQNQNDSDGDRFIPIPIMLRSPIDLAKL